MTLPIRSPYPPMEAGTAEELTTGRGGQYEPKWDGFRALVFRDGGRVRLQSIIFDLLVDERARRPRRTGRRASGDLTSQSATVPGRVA